MSDGIISHFKNHPKIPPIQMKDWLDKVFSSIGKDHIATGRGDSVISPWAAITCKLLFVYY